VSDSEDLRVELRQLDLRSVMSTPSGRRLIFSLLEDAGVWSPLATIDPHLRDQMVGRRDFGCELMMRVQATAGLEYFQMIAEDAKGRIDQLLAAEAERLSGKGPRND
jgi:hypothetical protein